MSDFVFESNCSSFEVHTTQVTKQDLQRYDSKVNQFILPFIGLQLLLVYYSGFARRSELRMIQRDMEELGFMRDEFDDSFSLSSEGRQPPNIMRDMSLFTQYLILVG